MAYVFILNIRDDAEAAEEIAEFLRQQVPSLGVVTSADIRPGSVVSGDMQAAISETEVIVILLSDKSLASPWMTFEMGMALWKEETEPRTVVIAVHVQSGLAEPSFLAGRERIEMTTPETRREALVRLADRLLARARGEFEEHRPPEERFPPSQQAHMEAKRRMMNLGWSVCRVPRFRWGNRILELILLFSVGLGLAAVFLSIGPVALRLLMGAVALLGIFGVSVVSYRRVVAIGFQAALAEAWGVAEEVEGGGGAHTTQSYRSSIS
jgi:hypothetical protein